MTTYYNEIDPYAAQWLRNLIAAGHIAGGEVDERSICDVKPEDIRDFTQCHFFAGIGVWSHALRLAQWPDARAVWTGSCPCQPFSLAGKSAGVLDERHLWPHWFWLIEQCRPAVVFGEQVEAALGHGWLDLVQSDLEGLDYAVGAVGLPAAGVGAPHIRQRLWFVAHDDRRGLAQQRGAGVRRAELHDADGRCAAGVLAHADGGHAGAERQRADAQRAAAERDGAADQLGNTDQGRLAHSGPVSDAGGIAGSLLPGFWSRADWIACRDGKSRPVEPIPLKVVDGVAESLGRLRAADIAEVEREMNDWSIRHQADAREALRNLWRTLSASEVCQRSVGRSGGVSQPAVLLAFLRQLEDEGWPVAQGVSRAGAEASSGRMRVLRLGGEAAGSPLRRGLDEQHASESADPLYLLPPLLARHAQAAWGEAFDAHAAATFPLAHGAPARVGRLRAYGNAIVPQVAAEVIATFMEYAP